MTAQRQMKDVGVREFRDHATKYLSGSDTLAIRKNGHLIGIYIPMKRDEEKVRLAWDRFGETIDQILQEAGMAEGELADPFDLSRLEKRDKEKAREALERFGRTVEQIRKETGMTEDEFADMFDLTKPFPE